MTANQEYNRAVKKKILEYVMSHSLDDNSWTKIRNHLAEDKNIAYLRALRNYKKGKEDYDFNDERFNLEKNRKKFDNITTVLLNELIGEGKIKKRKKDGAVRFYAKKPIENNLQHGEIAIVKTDYANALKAIVEQYSLEKNLVLIPTDEYLICTLKKAKKNTRLKKYIVARKSKDEEKENNFDLGSIDVRTIEQIVENKLYEKENERQYERDYIVKCVRDALKKIEDDNENNDETK